MLAGWFLGDACSCSYSMPLVIQDPVIGFNNRYLFLKKGSHCDNNKTYSTNLFYSGST